MSSIDNNSISTTPAAPESPSNGAAGGDDSVATCINKPRHIAIIMDGNNRWAKQRRLPGIAGHKAGVEVIRKVLQSAESHGIEVLTLFAFSSENWRRPASEVSALMRLFLTYLNREVTALHEKSVKIKFIGRRDRLSDVIVEQMQRAERLTQNNIGRTLVLAVDYGGQWDICNAARQLYRELDKNGVDNQVIDEQAFQRYLSLGDMPPPDLCIRTGGEHRISNFLLWQLAYAELYFADCYWPDFDEVEFNQAITAFSGRQRRFGKTGEQVEEQVRNA